MKVMRPKPHEMQNQIGLAKPLEMAQVTPVTMQATSERMSVTVLKL